jgi:deoxyuridine 5'-triphosphate nucleotidohydrolase
MLCLWNKDTLHHHCEEYQKIINDYNHKEEECQNCETQDLSSPPTDDWYSPIGGWTNPYPRPLSPPGKDWTDQDTIDWDHEPEPSWPEPNQKPDPPRETPINVQRWERNFRLQRCPDHGIRIYSPEDQCDACTFDTTPINAVNLISQVSPQSETQDPQPFPQVLIKRIHPDAEIPKLAKEGDAGYDLRAVQDITIALGEVLLVPTGLEMEIPPGYYGQLKLKSGLALNHRIQVWGGVMDSCYRGETLGMITNLGFKSFAIKKGDKFAQTLFLPVLTNPFKEVSSLTTTARGKQGFGSTGINTVRQDLRKKMEVVHQDTSDDKYAYHLGKDLTPSQEKTIHTLMRSYSDVLATSFDELQGSNTTYQHTVDTGNHQPIRKTPYRLPPHHKAWVQEEIHRLMSNGIVRKSKSPWASPIVIIPKKDGKGGFTPRMCVDYRKLNEITVKDAHPLPRISDILEYIPPGSCLFSTFDLYMGYHQVGMSPEAIERSAFVTPDGHYEFTRMPFGLTNAPATFQRAMNEVFEDMIGKGLYVYLDDITIYSETFGDHMLLLKEVLRRLQKMRLYLKPKKCTIATHEVDLLGHVIGRDGTRPSPTKIKAVADYPRPTTKTELRSFLGLISYYRHFVPNCAAKIQPLSKMLQEHVPFVWDQQSEATFILIKRWLIDENNLLIRPDFNKPFMLHTDASTLGLGAVLSQMASKYDKLIAYASRRTSNTEAKYGATQLEALAVIWAIKHF